MPQERPARRGLMDWTFRREGSPVNGRANRGDFPELYAALSRERKRHPGWTDAEIMLGVRLLSARVVSPAASQDALPLATVAAGSSPSR